MSSATRNRHTGGRFKRHERDVLSGWTRWLDGNCTTAGGGERWGHDGGLVTRSHVVVSPSGKQHYPGNAHRFLTGFNGVRRARWTKEIERVVSDPSAVLCCVGFFRFVPSTRFVRTRIVPAKKYRQLKKNK